MTAPAADPWKPAREALDVARAALTDATKKGLAADSQIFFGAASAVEVAVEALHPPYDDRALAAQSCDEAMKLLKVTRAYAQRQAGGAAAALLTRSIDAINGALKLIAPKS
jgi:hypothetical protein